MTARQEMELFYAEHLPGRELEEDIWLHALGGVVVDEPNFFLLARGVDLKANWHLVVDPRCFFPRSQQNCWFIWARGGSDLVRMLTVAPYPLPYTAWSRRGNPFRVYRTDEALRLIRAHHKLAPTDEGELNLTRP